MRGRETDSMGSDRLCVKPVDPDTMFSAEDRRTMPQLRTWRWYDVRARSSPHDWDREVLFIRRAIACLVDRLRSPGDEPGPDRNACPREHRPAPAVAGHSAHSRTQNHGHKGVATQGGDHAPDELRSAGPADM